MMRGRKSLRDSHNGSPEGSEEEDARSFMSDNGEPKSPVLLQTPSGSGGRGRKGKPSGGSSIHKKDEDEPMDTLDVMH